jgi:lipoic acid synthetase
MQDVVLHRLFLFPEPHLQTQSVRNISRMPPWIRQKLGAEAHFGATRHAVSGFQLNTVCEEARCPNRGECWSRGTATFMLLGDTCTRACGFCSVKTGKPAWFDTNEPIRIAEAAMRLNLNYLVLTSVNRDDLEDGGAWVFAESLRQLRARKPDIGVEFLTPDFRSVQDEAVSIIMDAVKTHPLTPHASFLMPHLVWGHNVETVPRLYKTARKGSQYGRSLALLEKASKQTGVETKSALMLGLGETREEIIVVLRDLRNAGVTRVSLGQYLRPTLGNLPVSEYIHPDVFAEYENEARALGFGWVKAGPLVRSSYFAEEIQQEQQRD